MDIRQPGKRPLIAPGAMVVIAMALLACGRQDEPGAARVSAVSTEANALVGIPNDVPRSAAEAMRLAQKWHHDAQMIDLRIRESNNYALEFLFSSPSDRSTFYVTLVKARFTSQVMPPVTTSATGGPLPLNFLDLPAAIAKAEQRGMPKVIKEAALQSSSAESARPAWAIQPETDESPYLYTVDATTGAVPQQAAAAPPGQSQRSAISNDTAPKTSSGSNSAPAVTQAVMASGLLQKCLGITPGADKMMKGPGTQQYCKQLPGASLFDQAGERFKVGDHAGAAQLVRKAADAENAVAQLRLALMYDQGDGVPRSARTADIWYSRAAAHGEPESLSQMGHNYEVGEGVDENWDLAAKLYEASALQGWVRGQFALGRAYQFGIGVPQDRQQAIAWFRKAAAQKDPDGDYWANWLRDFTNNIGFRDDVERSIVMDVAGKLRFSGILSGGDPYGVTFHNSAQRALWLEGQRQRVEKDEEDTFRKIRQADHEECLRTGRDSC
jgi:TPR repeat protein